MKILDEMTPGSASPPPPRKAPVKVGKWTVLASLPALACALGMAIALILGANQPLVASYTKEANRLRGSIKEADFAARLVCLRRLSHLEPEKEQYRFDLAMVLSALKRYDEAEEILRAIAPPDRKDMPEAHLWLVEWIMHDLSRLPRYTSELEARLLRILEKMPNSNEAKMRLGLLYSLTGRPLEARPLLEATVGKQPDRLLILARVCERLGDAAACVSNAREALSLLQHRVDAQPGDPGLRILSVEACLLMRDYPGVIAALERNPPKPDLPPDADADARAKAKTKAKTDETNLRKATAQICAQRVDYLANLSKLGKAKSDDWLEIVRLGLRLDDTNPRLMSQLGGLMRQGGKEGDEARALLDATVTSNPAAADVHAPRATALALFVLGCDAWTHERVEEAREHWEKAYKIDPDTPSVSNNLAWLLAYYKPVDLNRAMTLIDHEIKLFPRSAEAHGTRGQILVKMGRYQEGAQEIEAVLAAGVKTKSLIDALRVANEHLQGAKSASATSPSPE